MPTEPADETSTVADNLPGGKVTWLLLLAGLVLFLVPEPVTSILGVLVALAGIGVWLAGRLVS